MNLALPQQRCLKRSTTLCRRALCSPIRGRHTSPYPALQPQWHVERRLLAATTYNYKSYETFVSSLDQRVLRRCKTEKVPADSNPTTLELSSFDMSHQHLNRDLLRQPSSFSFVNLTHSKKDLHSCSILQLLDKLLPLTILHHCRASCSSDLRRQTFISCFQMIISILLSPSSSPSFPHEKKKYTYGTNTQ